MVVPSLSASQMARCFGVRRSSLRPQGAPAEILHRPIAALPEVGYRLGRHKPAVRHPRAGELAAFEQTHHAILTELELLRRIP